MDAETAMHTPPPPLLTKADIPEIIQRYRAGESLATIAEESTVKVRQLYNWLLDECGDVYRQVQTECLMNRIADADSLLLGATDALQLARAREVARFARFDLERRRPHLYGPKQEVKQDTTVTITVQRYLPDAPKQLNATPQPVVVGTNKTDEDE